MTIPNKLTRKIKTLLFIVAPHVPSSESTRNTIPLANITYSAALKVWNFLSLKSYKYKFSYNVVSNLENLIK